MSLASFPKIRFLVLAAGVTCCAAAVSAQESTKPATSTEEKKTTTQQSTELLRALQELQAQMAAMSAKLDQVNAAQEKSATESAQLRKQLAEANARIAALEGPKGIAAPAEIAGSYEPAPAPTPTIEPVPPVSAAQKPQNAPKTLEERLSRIEENQDFIDAKINDQYQTKVESGSKYRIRLSGIALFNLYANRGSAENDDFPMLATDQHFLGSDGSFGGSLRQSQIGLEGFGPEVAGARTSANLRVDFAGGFEEAPNGTVLGLIRLRTATFRMDWKNTSLIGGQDSLFFAPNSPTSLATLATPALSYSGNLWGWTPQLRIEHRFHVSENSTFSLQGGILDPLSGDVPENGSERIPSWAEQAGQPAYAARVAWKQKANDLTWTLGAGGFYGRQNWGYGRDIDMWAATVDWTVPITRMVELRGAFYRGKGLGGFGGGVGQGVLFSGSLVDPATSIHSLDSTGGWAQLKYKVRPNFEFNGAFGQDNPFASEMRRFPIVASYYGYTLSKNRTWFVNFIYQLRSNILFSAEFRRINSFELDDETYNLNHINFSVGYIF